MHKNRWLTVLLSAILVFSLGCNFTGQLLPGSKGPPGDGNNAGSLATPGVYPTELTAPLPAPLSITGNSLDEEAATLAKAVLADDQNSLPALLAAFQESGIAIRGADGGLANQPVEPWQGLIYDAWEMPMLMNMVRQDSFVSINLGDLTETLRAIIPEFQDAPLTQLFIDEIQANAQSQEPTKHFLTQFIVELGRQAQAHQPYDLLGQVDPANVNLDGIQTSLILRRLAVDLMIYANSHSTGMDTNASRQYVSLSVHAQAAEGGSLPCTMTSTEKTILDITSFAVKSGMSGFSGLGQLGLGDAGDGFLKYLDKNGVAGADTLRKFSSYANILLAWGRFIYTYVALKVDISIDNEPLIRTQRVKPAYGAQQKLIAVVKMDVGNAQMLNCFRLMLNGIGADFRVPQDGVLKGVHVAWDGRDGFDAAAAALHGGPEQIVQLAADPQTRMQAGGDPSSGINPITNQVTDNAGKAYIDVQGVGQLKEVPANAKPVSKHATVGVRVAVKGSDIISDLNDAAKAGLGGVKSVFTMPTEILYRMKWAISGYLTFEVTDWTAKYAYTGDPSVISISPTPLCDLEKPFVIKQNVDNEVFSTTAYTPDGPTTGTYKQNVSQPDADGLTESESGTYILEFSYPDDHNILVDIKSLSNQNTTCYVSSGCTTTSDQDTYLLISLASSPGSKVGCP